jgi:hypothetical protein
VPSDGFEDRRNPDPILNLDRPRQAFLSVDSEDMCEFTLRLPSFPSLPDFVFNQPIIAQRYQTGHRPRLLSRRCGGSSERFRSQMRG